MAVTAFFLNGCPTRSFARVPLGGLTRVVALHASVAALDPEGRLIGWIGEGMAPTSHDGGPNTRWADGKMVRRTLIEERFNSPHAIGIGSDWSIDVAESVLGDRLVRIVPAGTVGAGGHEQGKRVPQKWRRPKSAPVRWAAGAAVVE